MGSYDTFVAELDGLNALPSSDLALTKSITARRAGAARIAWRAAR